MIIFAVIIYLIIISYYDIKTHIIADGMTLLGMLIALNYQLFFGSITQSIIGLTVGVSGIFIINTLKIQHLGGGDAKLLGMIGAFTNWQVALLTILIAYFLRKIIKSKKKVSAYAPFITTSFILVILCQNAILYLTT